MATNTAYTSNVTAKKQDGPLSASGRITYPSTSIVATDYTQVDLGFIPTYIQWCDVTSRVQIEWFEGMAANSCVKTAANGTRTLEVTGGNGGITVCDSDGTANTAGRSFKVLQNATLAAILASEVVNYRAGGG